MDYYHGDNAGNNGDIFKHSVLRFYIESYPTFHFYDLNAGYGRYKLDAERVLNLTSKLYRVKSEFVVSIPFLDRTLLFLNRGEYPGGLFYLKSNTFYTAFELDSNAYPSLQRCIQEANLFRGDLYPDKRVFFPLYAYTNSLVFSDAPFVNAEDDSQFNLRLMNKLDAEGIDYLVWYPRFRNKTLLEEQSGGHKIEVSWTADLSKNMYGAGMLMKYRLTANQLNTLSRIWSVFNIHVDSIT